MSALLSSGERLMVRLGLDQFMTTRSNRGYAFQAGPLWLPPFCCRHHTPEK